MAKRDGSEEGTGRNESYKNVPARMWESDQVTKDKEERGRKREKAKVKRERETGEQKQKNEREGWQGRERRG